MTTINTKSTLAQMQDISIDTSSRYRTTHKQDEFMLNNTRHIGITPDPKIYANLRIKDEFEFMEFEHQLDDFQKVSLTILERDESVLVSAHTSSGKTLVAEYAIALALIKKQRVIYTSPIKALSNQKYRELCIKFTVNEVGLMTGDVTLNQDASIIVMTTEILRNMLYRGSEIIREVHWLVYDEIHYLRDRERGVVWEESIILLPSHIEYIFLSATIPNAQEFAEWVCSVHNKIVHVVYTEKRPVPLQFYIAPKGAQGMIFLGDTEKQTTNSNEIFRKIKKASKNFESKRGGIIPELKNIVDSLIKNNNLPAVIFSFSRKECEKYAAAIGHKQLVTNQETETIGIIFDKAILSLREEDRKLDLIGSIKTYLVNGIGIHHSGLLPIIKELVEILFQENLLKLLFATETFSIGLNMPVKTTVFTSIEKFDGVERRSLTGGEFIQMSGRAGRRGIDKKGLVVIISSTNVIPLIKGSSDLLTSAFRLCYNMILNLMRVEDMPYKELLGKSFFQFQIMKKRETEGLQLQLILEKIKKSNRIKLIDSKEENNSTNLIDLENEVLSKNDHVKLIKNLKKGKAITLFIPRKGAPLVIKTALVNEVKDDFINCYILTGKGVVLWPFKHQSVCKVHKLITCHFKNPSVYKMNNRKIGNNFLRDNFKTGWSDCVLCGRKENQVLSECLESKCLEFDLVQKEVSGNKTLIKKEFNDLRREIISELLKRKMEDYEKLNQLYYMKACIKMVNVLKRLEYCDESKVLIKGKVACEIRSGDELLLTEMIFNGKFQTLTVDEVIALLSCVLFDSWEKGEVQVSIKNLENYSIIKETVSKICEVMDGCNLDVDYNDYLNKFSNHLMDVTQMWACGFSFGEVCAVTCVFEGNIIRIFRRLEELLRQLSSASRAIGNTDLENLFALAITKIKRDIVFTNSLYL